MKRQEQFEKFKLIKTKITVAAEKIKQDAINKQKELKPSINELLKQKKAAKNNADKNTEPVTKGRSKRTEKDERPKRTKPKTEKAKN